MASPQHLLHTLDLTRTVPRSPGVRLGGLVHLARMLDKARARHAGTLGEYKYPCPLDQRLLQFLGIAPDDFLAAAAVQSDKEMVEWVAERARPHSSAEREAFCSGFLALAPVDEEGRRYFSEQLASMAPGRNDITTWVQLIDLEEGRL